MECNKQFFHNQWHFIYRRICGVQVRVEFARHRHNGSLQDERNKIVARNDRSGSKMKRRGKSARY